MNQRDTLLDIKEAALFLHVSETSLRRWTNAGILPCLRVGRRRERRFRYADLLSFMEEQPHEQPSHTATTPVAEAHAMDGLHLCFVYTSDEDRNRITADFFQRGMEAGAHCFFWGRRPVYEAVSALLGRRGAERVAHMQYAATTEEPFAVLESAFGTALRAGAPSIYSAGDAPPFPPGYSLADITANELAYDRIAHRYRVTTACLYDARAFTSLQLVAALRGHHDMLQQPLAALLG